MSEPGVGAGLVLAASAIILNTDPNFALPPREVRAPAGFNREAFGVGLAPRGRRTSR